MNRESTGGNNIVDEPNISVVAACYNDKRHLTSALGSIRNQECTNVEYIVIDGGSTDRSVELLANRQTQIKGPDDIDFKYTNKNDEGLYDVIEKVFEFSTCDIYCWLNADDKWFPWTARIVSEIFKTTEVKLITGHNAYLDDRGRITHIDGLRRQYYPAWIKRGCYGKALAYLQQEPTFWTRELWEQVGGFPDNIDLADDYWLWRQFAQETELITVDTVLAAWRSHEGNQLSENQSKFYSELDRSHNAEFLGDLQADRIYSLVNNLLTNPVSECL